MDVQEKKLRQSIWIIIGVGIFLTIALAVGLVTQVINKQRQEIAARETVYRDTKQRADALPGVLVERQKAQDRREYVNGQIKFFQQRYRSLRFDSYTPTIQGLSTEQLAALGTNNRNVAWRRWMNEYASGYGVALRRELITIANQTGVTLKTSVKVGDPPKAPEEAVPPANGLFRPTGGALPVSITGALGNILQFFNRVSQSSILMLVNNDLKMSGYSPDITASFSITPYLLASGDVSITAAAPAAGAPGTGPTGGQGGPPTGPNPAPTTAP